ncbi:MAG: sugar phosphate isomerase/epimerase [Halioglobus sp.]
MEGVSFPEFARHAADAGFAAVTINSALYEDAVAEGFGEGDLKRFLDDLGLVVSDVDPLFNWLPDAVQIPGNDIISRCTRASIEEVFHLAKLLGCDLVNAPPGLASPDSEQQIVDGFAALCEQAAAQELRICLEFMPFTRVPDLQTAARIVSAANCDNGGIMIDCWHHHRSGGTAEDVLAVPADKFFAMQLDDALAEPMQDILEETLNHRLLPGEGCIDLPALLTNLHAIGAQPLYDVEVFKASLRECSATERASQLFNSANKLLNGAD